MAATPRIRNRDAGFYAGELKPFQGSHLYGRWVSPDMYVVYSYGPHWPLFVWDGRHWWANTTRSSRSTNTHKRLAWPRSAQYQWILTCDCSVETLLEIVRRGVAGAVANKILTNLGETNAVHAA